MFKGQLSLTFHPLQQLSSVKGIGSLDEYFFKAYTIESELQPDLSKKNINIKVFLASLTHLLILIIVPKAASNMRLSESRNKLLEEG
jgi:hypothetical protein